MKTKLFIAFLMISSITFAQKKNNNQNTKRVVSHMKIDDIKGESNDTRKSTQYMKIDDIKGESNYKRTIKIGGAEKPYARSNNDNNKNSRKWWTNRKMKEAELKNQGNQRRRGDVKLEDIQITKKTSKMRRRVNKTKRQKGKTNNQYLHSL